MSHSSFSAACKHPGTVAALKRQSAPASHALHLPYPETVNLPFNRQALPDGFELHATPQHPADRDGVWVLLQGGAVLMRDLGDQLLLPEGTCPAWLDLEHPPAAFASFRGRPVRAVAVPSDLQIPTELVSEPFNAFRERIAPDLMSIAGVGKQLLHW